MNAPMVRIKKMRSMNEDLANGRQIASIDASDSHNKMPSWRVSTIFFKILNTGVWSGWRDGLKVKFSATLAVSGNENMMLTTKGSWFYWVLLSLLIFFFSLSFFFLWQKSRIRRASNLFDKKHGGEFGEPSGSQLKKKVTQKEKIERDDWPVWVYSHGSVLRSTIISK